MHSNFKSKELMYIRQVIRFLSLSLKHVGLVSIIVVDKCIRITKLIAETVYTVSAICVLSVRIIGFIFQ